MDHTAINLLVSALIVGFVLAVPFCWIFRRAGFSAAWGLLAFVPLFGPFACLLILGLRPWPVERIGVE